MLIKLVKDVGEAKAGSVIQIEDKDLDSFVKDGHIIYTEAVKADEVQTKSLEQKEIVKEEIKMTIETKAVEKEITAPNIIISDKKEVKSMGDLFQKVLKGDMGTYETKAPAGMNEDTSNADGGFIVSHDIDDQIRGRLFEGGKVYPKCQKIQLGPNYNGRKLPYLDISSQTTATQPRLFSLAEGGVKTPTKFTFGQHDLALVKLIGLVPITDELLQDRTTLEGYVMSQIKGKFAWQLDYNILFGTVGTTGNMGVLDASAAAFVTTPIAHSGTWTTTIVQAVENGVAPQVRSGAEWYMSGQAWATIKAQLGRGVASILNPIADRDALDGYPVNVVDGMAALNGVKDVCFANLNQVVVLEKGGLQIDMSKEFYFDTDQIALRFVVRQASAPVFAKYTAVDSKDYAALSSCS